MVLFLSSALLASTEENNHLTEIQATANSESLNSTQPNSNQQNIDTHNLYMLGESYLKGASVERSYPLAMQYFQQAAEFGHEKAHEKLIWLKSYLPNEPSLQKRYRRELQAAKTESATAQFLVAEMCEFGLGVEPNLERAVFWYKKSAEQNYGQAQNRLAELYSSGVIKEDQAFDNKQAFLWVQAAANNEQAQAQFKLASYYAEGYLGVVDVNKELAFFWFEKSAQNGHIQGQMQTAHMLKNGNGVTQNYEQALYWYEQALAQNYELAREQVREVNNVLDDIFLKNFK